MLQGDSHGGAFAGELNVLFFTDGVATNKDAAEWWLQKLKGYLHERRKTLRSQFLCVGYRRDHDEVFLKKLSEAGTFGGYYNYIDDKQPK
jgi:hypothetical protein